MFCKATVALVQLFLPLVYELCPLLLRQYHTDFSLAHLVCFPNECCPSSS